MAVFPRKLIQFLLPGWCCVARRCYHRPGNDQAHAMVVSLRQRSWRHADDITLSATSHPLLD
jgi:hypothetical protein